MGYDRGDSFPFDFEPNGIPFGSENRKENCHHDHIPFDVRGIGNIVFSVQTHIHTHTHHFQSMLIHQSSANINLRPIAIAQYFVTIEFTLLLLGVPRTNRTHSIGVRYCPDTNRTHY